MALFAKKLFAGSSMAVAAFAYLGKTMLYDLCPECNSCEHISSRWDQICSRGKDIEDKECHSSPDIWGDC